MNTPEKILPITPAQAKNTESDFIPDWIIGVFNTMISAKYSNGESSFKRDEIIDAIQLVDRSLHRQDIFDRKWLDVEPVFRRAGWKVEYDQPAYNESYEPTYTFRGIR
jgi:hypothetical protein